MIKKIVRVLVLVMLLLPAIGCGVFEIFKQEDFRIFKPSLEDDQEIMADSFLEFNLLAWQDVNGNGVWEDSEMPLEGVAFSIEGDYAQRWPREPGMSNEEGQCTMRIWYPGFCSAKDYIITATNPEAYESTTPESVIVHYEANDFDSRVMFGFRRAQDQ